MSSQESSRVSKRKHTEHKESPPSQTEIDKLIIRYKESVLTCKNLQPQIQDTKEKLDDLKEKYEHHRINRDKLRNEIIQTCQHTKTLKSEINHNVTCGVCGEELENEGEDDSDFDVEDY
jgi:uncharacterized coiled-coil DUF342 family protein